MILKPKANQVINGTFGKLWINGMKFANVKSFEAKLTFDYEDIDIAEDTGKHRKYMGFQGEGTFTLHKVDSAVLKIVQESIKSGRMPDIMFVGALTDPAALGSERIQFDEITLDELTLLKFEQKTVGEEEVPFKFASYTPLDLIA